jgi:DNA transposition AAA+ family ATPase
MTAPATPPIVPPKPPAAPAAAGSPDDLPINSSALGLSERQTNRVPGYKVAEATEGLPDSQRLQIRWLHAYYYDSGRSLAEVGQDIGYDGGNVSKIFVNKYSGDLDAVAAAIKRFREILDLRANANKAPYIRTALYDEIEQACETALAYQKIAYLYGESQVGKTEALKEYTRTHNHGQTIFVTMPVGGSLSHFLAALAAKVRCSNQQRGDVLQLNIMKCFGPSNLLIVDECSRALQSRSYGGSNLRTMDFIRDLHDQSQCGVVLCGTNVFRDQMADKALGKFLNQFNRRCIVRRQLPDRPRRADLNAFARHYGLDPAGGEAYQLQRAVVAEHGLGVWLTSLRAAAKLAGNKAEKMTWSHVVKAHAFLRRMEEQQHAED